MRRFIITGGLFVIAAVIGILFLIGGVAMPLFQKTKSETLARFTLPIPDNDREHILGVGIDEYMESCMAIGGTGRMYFMDIARREVTDTHEVKHPGAKAVPLVLVQPVRNLLFHYVWKDGASTLVKVEFYTDFDAQGKRSVKHRVNTLTSWEGQGQVPRQSLSTVGDGGVAVRADLLDNGKIALTRVSREEDFMGNLSEEKSAGTLESLPSGSITALSLDRAGRFLYAATDKGYLARWDIQNPEAPVRMDYFQAFEDGRVITSLALVMGDISVAVGDARGGLSTWFPVRRYEDAPQKQLALIHPLQPHAGAVMALRPSERDKSLFSINRTGSLHADHMTSERRLLTHAHEYPLVAFAVSGRNNSLVAIDDKNTLLVWTYDCPHPEVSWKTLFAKVWYENYDRPEFVWQSSAAGDAYEPKLSLRPLIFGTIKGTLYAMLFAGPIAILGALYTNQFMRPKLRNSVKPVIEIMAAVPSVVVGFLAALWLAPLLDDKVSMVFLTIPCIPLALMAALFLWRQTRHLPVIKHLERGYEFVGIIPVLLIGMALALGASQVVDQTFFGGDFRQWLYDLNKTNISQRNCIIIAFALGFAVIPVIFTMTEDAFATVPQSLSAASLALGASRWQTAWRVVLPSASPAIFAAVMIGVGRAVGETMIVLMATGNTPIMDWSIFNGMRTLSANIAVEIPEAPHNGTLYRVLFLSAVILFIMTFVLNTVAEVVRQRLRRKYGNY